VTTNSTSDPTSGTGGEPAKPTRARKPAAAKTGAATTGDKPAATRTRAAAKPKAAAANGDAAAPAKKPAAKRAPAKSRAKAADSPVAGGAVQTPLAPDAPTEVAPVEVAPAVEAAPPSDRLTARDLLAALRAAAHGADASEVLGENVRWEAMFAALLSLLLKKHLIADWEFVEELKKQL